MENRYLHECLSRLEHDLEDTKKSLANSDQIIIEHSRLVLIYRERIREINEIITKLKQ